jgi:hypothetical protein
MLMMRARSWALRDGFADVLRGLSIREEVEDYATPLAEPLPVPGKLHSKSNLSTAPRRPRFADYIAAGNTRERRIETRNVTSNKITVVAARATDAEPSPIRTVTPASATRPCRAISPTNNVVDEGDAARVPACPGEEPSKAPESASSLGHGDVSSYTLVDADGNFIELTSLEALRVAFGDLFSDRSLSEAQALGLWESNEIARRQLMETFGEAAVEISVARLSAVTDESNRPRSPQPASQLSNSTIVAHPSATPTHPNEVGGFGTSELKINPAWSDEKVLHHYQAHLLKLRLQRADAAEFVDFRLSNQPTEDRLRTRLPHMMSDIDDVYTWASTEAR